MRAYSRWLLLLTLPLGACGDDEGGDTPTDTSGENDSIGDTETDADRDGTAPDVGDDGEGDGSDYAVPDVETTSLGLMRVEGGALIDAWGRHWVIRGINARIDGLFDVSFDDGRLPLEEIPEFDADDVEAMAGMGFGMLRLPINWSGLEPTEGEFSARYLERLDEVVRLCTERGIYVLIDFHQDAYSKEIGEDGAPLWAILPPPTELLGGPLDDLAQRRSSVQVGRAFESFFNNEEGLRDRFIPAWQLITARYAAEDGVIGFEVMNEPVTTNFDRTHALLYEFYEQATVAMREVNTRHTLWLEPDSIRNFANRVAVRPEPFGDPNVVYCPHLYPGLSGISDDDVAGWTRKLTPSLDNLVREAQSWGAAPFIGEWGTHPNDAWAESYFDAVNTMADARGIGRAFWLWKENSQGSWGLYDHDEGSGTWTPREAGIDRLAKPYAMAVPGRLLTQSWDPASGELRVTFAARGGEAPPLVWLSESVRDGAVATIDGAAAALTRDESGRALVAWDGQPGTRELVVRAAD
jgi:hypothetical protein